MQVGVLVLELFTIKFNVCLSVPNLNRFLLNLT